MEVRMLLNCLMPLALLIPGEADNEPDPPPVWDDRPMLAPAGLTRPVTHARGIERVRNEVAEQTFALARDAWEFAALWHELILLPFNPHGVGFEPTWLLGQPSATFLLGSKQYYVYANYGIRIGKTDEDMNGKLLCIECIPAKVTDTAADAVRRDMKRLQGAWTSAAEDERWPLDRTAYVFDDDRLTLVGGGIAVGMCYRLDAVQKTIHFYLPDPEDDEQWREQGLILPDLVYALQKGKIQFSSTVDGKVGTLKLARIEANMEEFRRGRY
jgi:hypothetical protein